jgi:hypothetical protein
MSTKKKTIQTKSKVAARDLDEAGHAESIYVCPLCGCYREALIQSCRVGACPKGARPNPIDATSDLVQDIPVRRRTGTGQFLGFYLGLIVGAGSALIVAMMWMGHP